LACLGATLINPLGWHIYEGVLGTIGHFVQQYITEWRPYYRAMSIPQSIPTCAYVLGFVVLELRGKGSIPVETRILSWCFLALGIYQLRNLTIFFLFSPAPVALHLSKERWSALRLPIRESLLGAAGVSVFCTLPFLYAHMVAVAPDFPPIYPEAEIAYLAEHVPNARLLNHWNYGGILIFRERGSIPVFVDGRAATAYPDTLLRDYFPLTTWQVDESAWRRVIERYNIDTVLWPKVHEELATFLVDKEKWLQIYSGSIANVYVRPR